MAATRIVTDTMEVLTFVRERYPIPAVENMQGIGLVRDDEMVAGVIYENWNGHSVWMHVAAVPGKRWMTRDYLKVCFGYPFQQLGVKSLYGWVPAENEVAQRFDEHLGFRLVSFIPGAGMAGGDVLIYRMDREECRYV